MGDLHSKAALPGELVHQRPPLVQLAGGGQQKAPATVEQPAQQARQPWRGMSRHRGGGGYQIISPRGRRSGVLDPRVVRVPAKSFEGRPNGRLEMEIVEGRHMVNLSAIAPVDIPRPRTNFSPVSRT